MSASLIALVTTLGPTLLGIFGRLLFTDPRPLRSIKRHAKLLEELPDEAKPPIIGLLVTETTSYAGKTIRRSQRTLNGSNLAALIIVGLIAAGVIYGGAILAVQLSWLWWIPTAAIGLFLILLLTIGGFSDFWKYPDEGAGVAPSP